MSMKLVVACWELDLRNNDGISPVMLRLILMALCDCARPDGTRCFPDIPYVVHLSDASRATVFRALELLESMGVIEPKRRRGRAVEYAIHLDAVPVKAPFRVAKLGRPRVEQPHPKPPHKKIIQSHHETELSAPAQTIQSHGETIQSHGETAQRYSDASPDQAPSAAVEASMTAYPVMNRLLTSQEPSAPVFGGGSARAAEAPRESSSLSLKNAEPEQSRAEHPVRWIDGVPALSWRLQVSQARWREGSAGYRRLRVELGKHTHPDYDTWERAIYWGGVSSETQRIAGYRDFTHELNRRWGPQPAPEDEMEGVTP